MNTLGVAILILFTLWIRFSVKSTAIIWLPIIYLAARSPKTPDQTTKAIKEERDAAVSTIIRLMAWASLAFFIWRFVIFPSSVDWWTAQPWWEVISIFVLPLGTAPTEISLWHLSSGINAALTLTLFYVCWDKYARSSDPIPQGIQTAFHTAYWLRGALSIFSVACGLYYAAVGAAYLKTATINWCLFPALCNP